MQAFYNIIFAQLQAALDSAQNENWVEAAGLLTDTENTFASACKRLRLSRDDRQFTVTVNLIADMHEMLLEAQLATPPSQQYWIDVFNLCSVTKAKASL